MSFTKDYSIFKFLDVNRNLDRKQIEKLKCSIQDNGYLDSHPIIVDKNFSIIDGQHRFVACKEMGLPIVYTISDNVSQKLLITLNTTQKKWQINDYIHYWAEKGYSSYKLLSNLMKETNQNSTVVINLLGQETGGRLSEIIQNGKFKTEMKYVIEARGKWNAIKTILDFCKIKTQTRPVKALLDLAQDKNFNWKTMVKKLERQGDRVHRCISLDGYKVMFRDIYNNRNSNPIELRR